MDQPVVTATAGRTWRVGRAPGQLPLIGHLVPLLRDPLGFVIALREYGDLVELRIGPKRGYAVCHPELLHQVLLDARTYDKGGKLYDSARDSLGNGVVSSNWADHRVQRRLVQPAFHRQRLPSYAAVMHEEAAALSEGWRPGGVVNINEATHALAARITFRSMFSTDSGAAVASEVHQALVVITQSAIRRTIDPTGLYQRLPLPANRRFARNLARLHTIIGDLISERRRSADGDHGDALSMLLAARDEETGAALTDGELIDQVKAILLGGGETTGSTLAWTFHLLTEHPEVERRLHDEVDRVLAGRTATFDDLPALGYTTRVLTETLRLWSPLWLLTRHATADTVLAGEPIPAGTDIVFSMHGLHRDPAMFEDPERFDPDRWLPERAASLPRHAMMPFVAGARKCMGEEFAWAEMVIALATIAGRWRLRPAPGARLRPRPSGTLTTGRLTMTTEPRRVQDTAREGGTTR